MVRVNEILDVNCAIDKSNPPNLKVKVKGQVPTTGWGPTQLLRRIYKITPSDGVWEYDLLSTPPTGPAGNSFSEVNASDTWEAYDARAARFVRVYGKEGGFVEEPIPSK